MNTSNPYIQAISLLERAGVPYVIVGGFAVVMHGCNRFTPDMNVMVTHERDSLSRLATLLTSGQFVASTHSNVSLLIEEDQRQRLFEDGRWFFSFAHLNEPSFSLDIFLHFPVPFEELYERRQEVQFTGGRFSMCSLEDLIAMKSEAGRGQDMADIGALKMYQSLVEKLEGGATEEELIHSSERDSEQEQIEGLIRFSRFSIDERLKWLGEMVTHLGRFCGG